MKFTSEDLDSENTWQIGTGDGTRMYHDIFLKFGVAFVSPGEPGKEGEEETTKYYEDHPTRKNWGAVLKQVQIGQWLIARKGKGYIVAIGKVIEDYNYSEIFSDVEGWDSQHYVKVKWYVPKTDTGWLELDSYCLSQSTLQGCYKQEVYDAIYDTEFEEYPSTADINQISERKLKLNEIVDYLIDHGIRIGDADNVVKTLDRIIRLTNYYFSYHFDVSEAEIIAFLIAPTMIALGWSEQKIKFQLSNIDIAIFKNAFDQDEEQEPIIIIEAKKFNNGLAFTHGQINTYASNFPNCKKFIATNGYRYSYFEKEDNELICKGYINFLDLKEKGVLRELSLTSIETLLAISNFN